MIKQYDRVRLKDGREGVAVEIYDDPAGILMEIGSTPEDGDVIAVMMDEIEKAI